MLNNITALAAILGGDAKGNNILCPGPGHSHADRSLSIRLDATAPQGFLVHSFAGDDPILCRDYIKKRLAIEAFNPPPRSRSMETHSTQELALSCWREAVDPQNTPVSIYLASRGLRLPPHASTVLRYNPRCVFKLDNGKCVPLPAMVALMRNNLTNEPQAVHRTALKSDGSSKADLPGLGNPKKMLGPSRGCSVKLSDDEEATIGLAIAEGIETALAVMHLGIKPIWACGSATAITKFEPFEGVDCITIYGDADDAGRKAAFVCAERWKAAGKEARIILPREEKKDWNDIAQKGVNNVNESTKP